MPCSLAWSYSQTLCPSPNHQSPQGLLARHAVRESGKALNLSEEERQGWLRWRQPPPSFDRGVTDHDQYRLSLALAGTPRLKQNHTVAVQSGRYPGRFDKTTSWNYGHVMNRRGRLLIRMIWYYIQINSSPEARSVTRSSSGPAKCSA